VRQKFADFQLTPGSMQTIRQFPPSALSFVGFAPKEIRSEVANYLSDPALLAEMERIAQRLEANHRLRPQL
jgi:hypothetical protein